eukprot:GHRR01035863.1.p1 GENE.GHRR01035863.1~~GHRR01035863.1.p1  ORF type:complete len:107 (-),score=18.74 GHRR01035863.1:28-348(-)
MAAQHKESSGANICQTDRRRYVSTGLFVSGCNYAFSLDAEDQTLVYFMRRHAAGCHKGLEAWWTSGYVQPGLDQSAAQLPPALLLLHDTMALPLIARGCCGSASML